MRELLFRAYHRTSKTMYFFDLMWGNFKSGGGYIGMSETNDWNTRTFVDPTDCEIMQYTGLKDKNGVEVYEGDIIRYGLEEGLGQKERRNLKKIVDYSPYGYFSAYAFDIYVIGNIHQNPELL